jgi:hypothetical protein
MLVAADRTHLGIREVLHEAGEGVALQRDVGIREREDLAAGLQHTPVEGPGLAAGRKRDDAHSFVPEGSRDRFRLVRGPVRHDYDLELRRRVVDLNVFTSFLPISSSSLRAGMINVTDGRTGDFFARRIRNRL